MHFRHPDRFFEKLIQCNTSRFLVHQSVKTPTQTHKGKTQALTVEPTHKYYISFYSRRVLKGYTQQRYNRLRAEIHTMKLINKSPCYTALFYRFNVVRVSIP